jgi:uncharacterized protein with HEPN domain
MAAASVSDRLLHIRWSIAAIEGYWAGKTVKDFEANEPLRAATERHLLIISEPVRHIPQSDKDNHPQIPWRDIAGIGNILRHGYDIVDPRQIWSVIKDDLPALESAIAGITAHYNAWARPAECKVSTSAAARYIQLMSQNRIAIDPAVCNGKPTIRGMRITVQTLLEYLRAGESLTSRWNRVRTYHGKCGHG